LLNSVIESEPSRTQAVSKEPFTTLLLRQITELFRSRRDGKAMHSIFATWTSRAVSYSLRFGIVGLSIRALGHEKYGLWLTIGSFAAWLSLTDVGISGALLSRIAEAYARGETALVRSLVSSANRLYWGVAAGAATVAIVLAAFPKVIAAVGARGNLAGEGRWLLVVTGLLFAINIRASTVVQVCAALNEGYRSSYVSTLSALISFGVLLCAGSLIHSTISYALAISLPAACAPMVLAYVVYRRPPYSIFKPATRYFKSSALRDLLGLSFPMLQIQIADLVVNTSANILIANRLGLLAVPRFAVPWSLFWIFIGPLGTIFYSYWPPFIQAFTNGEFVWLRRRFLRMLAITTGVISVANLALVFIGPALVRRLAGPSTCPDRKFFGIVALYFLLSLIAYAFGILCLAINRIKFRGFTRLGVAVFHVVGFLLFVGKLGIAAFPVAGGIALVIEIAMLATVSFRTLYAAQTFPAAVAPRTA